MQFGDLCTRPLKLKHNRIRRPFKGGMLLDKWQNVDNPHDDHFGEEWIASIVGVERVNPEPNEGLSTVELENRETVLLKDVIMSAPEAFLGKGHVQKYGSSTALLVKAIDSCSRLLVQVHPDRVYAKEVMGSDFGKTEAWYIIDGRVIDGEEPYVMLGFKPGITRDAWKEMFDKQDIEGMKNALHRFNVKPGDVFFVNGGVPHAIGAGCFLIEVQEPTDLMMRFEKTSLSGVPFTDVEIHMGVGVDKMLNCFHYDSYTREELIRRYKIQPSIAREEAGGREIKVISSDYTSFFSMNKMEVGASLSSDKDESFSVAVVLSGEGKIIWDMGEMDIAQSDELFLPAGMSSVTWRSTGDKSLEIVMCYPGK